MVVLGLHFGHDASVAVIKDGKIVSCVERERLVRVKHVIGLSSSDILLSLQDAGLELSDVDYCAVTSTQLIEYVLLDKENLSIEVKPHPKHNLPCTLTDRLGLSPEEFLERGSGASHDFFAPGENKFYRALLPDADRLLKDRSNFYGTFEHFIDTSLWQKTKRLEDIARTDYSGLLSDDSVRQGFHYPGVVRVLGREIPCYFFAHHFAHAAYSFYESPFEDAAIFTHDGGGGGGNYSCGFIAYGQGNRLFPVTPHHIAIGETYDLTAASLGLGLVGGAGKLMGLAPYGRPRFFNSEFVGNWHETGRPSATAWFEYCVSQAQKMGYDMSPLGKKNKILEPVNVDIAASTQRLAEEVLSNATDSTARAFARSGIATDNMCFSGGFALNCPANRQIIKSSAFSKVFVPPAVHDGGLSAGAALALYYNMAENKRVPKKSSPSQAYLGLASSADESRIQNAIEKFESEIQVETLDDDAEEAAKLIASNQIIAWFEGRSEIGPRALGHRSILANPKDKENWKRVNVIKGREFWRPLAPVILEEDLEEHYESLDQPSYFMLINFMVRSKDTPATTHVDGSARVQMVNEDCGRFYKVLKSLKAKTGSSVVMNTSFNGPGEPVVELPEQAIQFLLNTKLDALILPGHKITRRDA